MPAPADDVPDLAHGPARRPRTNHRHGDRAGTGGGQPGGAVARGSAGVMHGLPAVADAVAWAVSGDRAAIMPASSSADRVRLERWISMAISSAQVL
jgi:hypothetical protein